LSALLWSRRGDGGGEEVDDVTGVGAERQLTGQGEEDRERGGEGGPQRAHDGQERREVRPSKKNRRWIILEIC
jgi:hypothetical protein